MKAELNNLKDFQLITNRILELEKFLSAVPTEVQGLESEWNAMKEKLEEIVSSEEKTNAALKEHQGNLEIALEKSKQFEKDLNAVTNSKEYAAVLKEIDSARKKVGHLNDEISKAKSELSGLLVNKDECTPLIAEAEDKFDEALKSHRDSRSEFSSELKEKEAQWDALKGNISQRLMSQFNRIASRRNGIGLSLVVDQICTACNVRVRPNVVDLLRTSDRIIRCDSCQRILAIQDEVLTEK